MISLEKIINSVLSEDTDVGGSLGSAAGGTSQFSSDFYAPGDARGPFIFGGIIRRPGFNEKKKGKKKRKKSK